ncbi:DUF3570 domain-containing protein [Polyangium sp. y55x31]|uniref:DUF3570 domain-containing protein n=1 Tax=Polyangium sp. y55x31 TaxID=3042688 RepID=UPI0024828526|nr:DUF3570 domain-containing protein [Polyangium sp. y55x31]MDI1476747.1 DUF3570 domain-containing protein [Polyangium sp. y55x31]
MIRRLAQALLAPLVAAAITFAPAPASAAPNDEEVEALVQTVLEASYKEGNYKEALDTLNLAKQACAKKSACSPKVRAKLYVALGTVLAGGMKKSSDAKAAFATAIKEDPTVALFPDFTSPEIQKAWNEARNAGSPSGGNQETKEAKAASGGSKKTKVTYEGQAPGRGWRTGEGSFYYEQAIKAEKQSEWLDCAAYGRASYEAEERTSTLFLVASCEARAGLWVEAVSDYEATAEAAQRKNIRQMAAQAQRRAEELRAKIPKIVVQKPAGATDVKVRLNGVELEEDQLGSEIPVNPGERTVIATGKVNGAEQSFEQSVNVGEGETATVEIKLRPKGKAIDRALVQCMQNAQTQDEFDECIAKNRKLPLNLKFGLEFSAYHDSDKVDVVSPTLFFNVENPTSGWGFGGSFLVDVVTAASTDIVATASPRWTEQRYVPALGGHKKFGDVDLNLHAAMSIEPDYLATSVGTTVALDLRQKTVTPSLSYDFSYDIAGRSGTSYEVFSRRIQRHALDLASSFVLDKNSVLTTNFSLVIESGDSSKPYRYIPTFAPDIAPRVLPGQSLATVNFYRNPERILEQLPLSRQRFALAGRYARRFSASTLRMEERLYADSWGLKATTTDLRYLYDVGKNVRIWPHFRFHAQTGTAFWQLAYVAEKTPTGLQVPALRTGDRELGPLLGVTGGLGTRIAFGENKNWGLIASGDVIYTRFLNTLFILQRFGYFGALTLEVDVE